LYEIGLKNECFSTKRFFEDIFNAIVNGLFLFLFCFYGEDGVVVTPHGLNGSFWVDGTMVYMVVVIVVNLKIAHVTNTHTWVSTFFIVASVLLFWIWLAGESALSGFPDVYKISGVLYSCSNTYWILIMCCWFNHGQFMLYYNSYVYLKQKSSE